VPRLFGFNALVLLRRNNCYSCCQFRLAVDAWHTMSRTPYQFRQSSFVTDPALKFRICSRSRPSNFSFAPAA